MHQKTQDRLTPQGLRYGDLRHFVNEDGNYLYCRYWEPTTPPRALVMILHGAGEHSGAYSNVATMLVNQSLFVFSHDHIGHGQSEGQRLSVPNFSVYVRDCLQHINMMKYRFPDLKIFLLAHSMREEGTGASRLTPPGSGTILNHQALEPEGITSLDFTCPITEMLTQPLDSLSRTLHFMFLGGLIAIYAMHDRPEDIAGAIFISPLVTLNPESARPWKVFCTKLLCHLMPNMSLGVMNPQWLSRDEKEIQNFNEDPLCYHGGMKVGFAAVLLNALTGLENILPTITAPVLILHGDADKMCDIKGSHVMFETVTSTDKTLKVFEESFHQLHKELPEVVKEVFSLIQTWLNDRLPPVNI
ncbi:monoglyceride lipase isoform X1 [Mobula hypostoma]|uniref:monoglyceride lipase isoform X1 n=1 Tax=Mobula hypostoma TaxID=723540 RepID=UPI002FC36A0A